MKKSTLNEMIRREVISVINENKKTKKKQFEGMSVEKSGHVETNEVGNFWVAMGPQKGDTSEGKGKKKKVNYFETDVFNLAEKLANGEIQRENIKGIFSKEMGARKMSDRLIKERETAVAEATQRAADLKSKLEGIRLEIGEFKKNKVATEQAVKNLKQPSPLKEKEAVVKEKEQAPSKAKVEDYNKKKLVKKS
jgi:hypothetical protein